MLRVVEAHLPLEHGEVVAHARQRVRQAGDARLWDHRPIMAILAHQHAQGALAHDLAQEAVAVRRVAAGQVGLVVVGGCRQVDILLGKLELGPELLQGIDLEDAVGHVAVALLGDLACPALAEALQLLQLAEALLLQHPVLFLRPAVVVQREEHGQPQLTFFPEECVQLTPLLPEFVV